MKLIIRKGKQNFIYFIILFVLVVMFLRSELGIPSFVTYSIDIINVVLLLFCFKKRTVGKSYKFFVKYICVFLFFVVLGLIINGQSFILFMWGLRSNFRFYVFFFSCALILTKDDCLKILYYLKGAFWVNVVVCTYQFLVLGYERDTLGGLFGSAVGCNGYMNILLLIIIAYSTVQYLLKSITIKKWLLYLSGSVYIAILSELKVVFVELIVIIILASLITNFSMRKLKIVLIGIVTVGVISVGIAHFYPEWANLFSVNGILENLTNESGYTGQGDINRLTAISYMTNQIGERGWLETLSGYGLGSCEYSDSFEFLCSPFYVKYGWTHYTWISYAWIYLETGFVGLVLFEGFFVLIVLKARKVKTVSKNEDIMLKTSILVAALCPILSVFNVSLRMECGYLVYFVLAIPLVIEHWNNYEVKNVES